jgi:hypothetical protein
MRGPEDEYDLINKKGLASLTLSVFASIDLKFYFLCKLVHLFADS